MLRPAFVVTVAALAQLAACDAGTAPGADKPTDEQLVNPPAPPEPRPSASESHHNPPPVGSADASKKKRPVRATLPKAEPLSGPAPAGQGVNPQDAEGRTIYARQDGHCFVKVPPATDAPKPKSKHPPERIALVDCPEAMQDAAWDTCLNGRMRRAADGSCFCRIDGNPPPPPWGAECPKSAK